ncbi:MAG TPA: hypothetical protein PKA37_13885 [Planctomycetota bacterium]|jgi:hypothetical protein|nr:hypothetical protein [Planctomycetota bacterium]
MDLLPLLISGNVVAGILFCLACAGLLFVLVRNRERCPKDNASMELVRPKEGKHMVFRCPKCHHEKKTHITTGRR